MPGRSQTVNPSTTTVWLLTSYAKVFTRRNLVLSCPNTTLVQCLNVFRELLTFSLPNRRIDAGDLLSFEVFALFCKLTNQ
jgi:hypothetical protein